MRSVALIMDDMPVTPRVTANGQGEKTITEKVESMTQIDLSSAVIKQEGLPFHCLAH